MLKRWSTKQFIFLTLIAALMFILATTIGLALNAITGISLAGGLVLSLISTYVLTIGVLVVRKFWAATIIALILMTLCIPTSSFGPPGIYKPIMGLVLGLIIDTFLAITRYRKLGYYLISIAIALLVPLNIFFLTTMGLPGADKMISLFLPLMGLFFVEALVGVWLARLTYDKKLKNSRLVRQIQS